MRNRLALLAALACAAAPLYADPYPTSGFGYVDRSGLNELLLRSAATGALEGGLLGASLSLDSQTASQQIAGAALVGGVAGLALPLVLSKDKPVPSGNVVLEMEANDLGIIHGLTVPALVLLGSTPTVQQTESMFAIAGFSGLIGLGAGILAADAWHLTPGEASALGSADLYASTAFGFIVAIIQPQISSVGTQRAIGFTGLAAGDLAVAAALLLPRSDIDMDRGRLIWMDVGGLLGVAFGFGVNGLVFPNPAAAPDQNDRIHALDMLVGGITGLAIAWYLTDDYDDYKRSAPSAAQAAADVDGSLVTLRGSDWAVGLPAPSPLLVSAAGAPALGMQLKLLDGKF